ncbi:hypothetical protein ACO0SA_003709 [Hanseniaspora valbyensis]
MGKLIGLEIFNFKSYKDKVSINIGSADFVSIIGPNGSGKSNIMDAISFVLGVDNKYLRSSSLTQLIYRGKKLNDENSDDDNNNNEDDEATNAFVEAHYQKDSGDIIKFHRDIDISGNNSFKINDSEVDFDSYVQNLKEENILVQVRNFLVFQGDVEQVASKNPQDLTDFFEQISGSIKFKKQYDILKNQYLKATAECEESIIEKRRLQTELIHYKESVIKDEKYSSKVEEKQHLWTQYYLWQLFQVDSELDSFYEKEESVDESLKKLEKNLSKKETSLQSFKSEHVEMEYNLNSKNSEIKKIENQINKIKNKSLIKLNNNRKTHLKLMNESVERKQLLKQDLEKQDTRLQKLANNLSFLENEKSKIEKNLLDITGEHSKYKNLTLQDLNDINSVKAIYLNDFDGSELDKTIQLKLNELDEKKSQLRKVNNQIIQTNSLILDLETELQDKINEIKTFQDNIKILESENKHKSSLKKKYNNKIQTLTKKIDFDNIKLRNTLLRIDELAADQRETKQEARSKEILRKLTKFFPGVKGFVLDLFRPSSKKYNQAVSLIIGRHLYSIVVDTALTATQCISYMKEQRLGIATFLPMDTITGVTPNFLLPVKGAVFATDVINCNDEFQNVLKYLCGDAIVSDSLQEAQSLKWEKNFNCKIISLNGSVIQKSGIMTGGVASGSSNDVRWSKVEFQELNSLKDELISEIQHSQDQIKALNELLKQSETSFENNVAEIHKLKDSIISVEKAKEQLLKQIEYNNNVIENDYNVEKDSVQSNIESINQTFTELCQKRDDIQQDLFQDLSAKLGFSVLEYEKTTGSFLREMKKELDLITREILQLNSKITFEEQKKNNIQNSATDLANIINNSEQILKDLDTEESEANNLITENENKLEIAKIELSNYKSTVKDEIQKIESLELEVNDIKQKVEETSTEQFSIKNDIETLSEQRFSILKTCRMNAIEIPLEDNVVFSDVKFEFMNDINEFNIDYDKLDKSLLKSRRKKLTDDEIDSQFQQKISVLEEELISLQPNVHAQERLNEIQAKFDDYNNHVVAELKQKEKKISTEFNKVKNDRKKTFMQTYEHVVKHIDSVYKELTTDPHNTNSLLAGGSATLSIEYDEDSDNANSDEPYLAGLKYQATPPLKKFKEIEYLSGGEKTVAALALLFTINSFKPSPFFILDEIDAALDSVNVLRVSNYIKKHANKDMQFIVISLKNSIYEESDSLVGVYRDQKLNSSRILTLDLSQYE